MGVDIKAGGRIKVRKRTDVKCDNPYLKLSVKLYKFLARRTDSKFNKVIANRLCQTRVSFDANYCIILFFVLYIQLVKFLTMTQYLFYYTIITMHLIAVA